jgi:tRNA(Ile)-lysidine synthase
LLSLTRAQVREFADVRAIVWVEDESNLDSQLRRNALRNVVMPAMARHFPGVPNTLSRAARLQAQAVRLLDEIADEDLCHIEIGDALDCNALICLSLSRQANAVRRWIARRGVRAASEARLRALLRAVGESSNDSRLLWRHENLRVVRRKALLMADVVDE